jgi:phage-related protein
MAITLGEVVVLIKGQMAGLQADIDAAKQASASGGEAAGDAYTKGFMSKLDKLKTALPASLSAIAAVGIVGVGKALLGLAADAAPLAGIAAAFQGISENADAMLSKLRAGSLGMVADTELMKQYNSAAQLVSTTFADQLPEAMGYLAKVSASTGESMDYLMESLVKGVGRLSPVILDNLKIQVDLEGAYTAYAASVGKVSDELTKEEQQTAAMNHVMELLARNTADMPEVAGGAAQGLASLSSMMANLKDGVGTALLPVLQRLLTPLMQLASAVIPMVIQGAQALGAFISGNLAPVLAGVGTVVVGLLIPAFQMIAPAIMAAMAPAIATMSAALPAILAVGVAAALLAMAWQNNWGGIRETTALAMNAIRSAITSVMASISAFWQAHGAQLMAIAQVVWNNIVLIVTTVLVAIGGIVRATLQILSGDWTAAWTTVQETTATILKNIQRIIADVLTATFGFVDAALRVLSTIFAEVFAWIQNSVIGQFVSGLTEHVRAIVSRIGDMAAAFPWLQNIVGPAIENIKAKLGEYSNKTKETATLALGSFRDMIGGLRTWAEAHNSAIKASMGNLRQYEAAQTAAASGAAVPAFVVPKVEWPTFEGAAGGTGAGAAIPGASSISKAVEKTAEEVLASIAKSMENLLSSIASIMDMLSEKLPEIPRDVVATWLDALRLIMQDVVNWVGLQGDSFMAAVQSFKVNLLPALQDWVEQSRVMGDLFGAIRSISDGLVSEVTVARGSVANMFDAVTNVVQQIHEYTADVKFAALSSAMDRLREWGAGLTEFATLLKPLGEALSALSGIANAAAQENAEGVQMVLEDMFDALNNIIQQLYVYMADAKFGMLSRSMVLLAGWKDGLALFAEQLKPLNEVLSGLKSLLDLIASRTVITQNSVSMFMQNILMMLETMATQFTEKEDAFGDASAALLALKPLFDSLAAAMGPMMTAMNPIMAMMDMVGKRLGIVRMDIEAFMNSVLGALQRIGVWGRDNGPVMLEAVNLFETAAKDNLLALGSALLSASGIMNDSLASAQAMGQGIGPLREGIGQFIDGLLDIKTLITNFLEGNDESDIGATFSRFWTAVFGALQILATGGGVAGEEGTSAMLGGMEQGMLMELLDKITDIVEQIKAPLDALVTWLLGTYRPKLAAISLTEAATKICGTFVDTALGKLQAFYDAGYDLGAAFVQGLNDATGTASPSKAMIAAGLNLTGTLVKTVLAGAERVYGAGVTIGTALEKGIRDALGMHSLSDVGLDVGENWALSVATGADRIRELKEMGLTPSGDVYTPSPRLYADTARGQWQREQAEMTNVTIAPQVSVVLSGATFLQNERDMQMLGKKLMPYISAELARDADLMERFGVNTEK